MSFAKTIGISEIKKFKYCNLFLFSKNKTLIAVGDGYIYNVDNFDYDILKKNIGKDDYFFSDDPNNHFNFLYEIARQQRHNIEGNRLAKLRADEEKRLKEEAEKRKQKELEEQIKKNEEIRNRPIPKNVDRAFDLSVINLDCNYPIEKIIDGIVNFSEQLKKGTNQVKNCCILLSGNSGTGKSEFAKYIASLTGLGFKHTRASDVLNKYVGETEKTIT